MSVTTSVRVGFKAAEPRAPTYAGARDGRARCAGAGTREPPLAERAKVPCSTTQRPAGPSGRGGRAERAQARPHARAAAPPLTMPAMVRNHWRLLTEEFRPRWFGDGDEAWYRFPTVSEQDRAPVGKQRRQTL